MQPSVRRIIQEYLRPNGSSPYADWFDRLPPAAAARVTHAKVRMALGGVGGFKSLGGGLSEWRIDWGPGLRVYLAQEGPELVLLLGGSDKGDQQREIDRARVLLAEYRSRVVRDAAGTTAAP